MSDCSRSVVFLLSGSVLLSWQYYGMLSALHSFRRRKAISSALVSGPFRRSVSSVGGDVGGMYDLILVGVDRWLKHSSTLSNEFFHSTECITLVWCPSV